MRKNSFFVHLALLVLMFVFTASCFDNSSLKKTKLRGPIEQEIKSLQKQLPMPIEGTGITITSVVLDGDIVAYTYVISDEDWKDIASSEELANSEKNLARIVSNVPSASIDMFIENALGIKMIYRSEESGKKLRTIEIPADKLKEIKEKTDTGELEGYSFLELTKMEISEMKFPQDLGDGIWITDAYVKGNKIYYVVKINQRINPSDLSSSDKVAMKKQLISDLKAEKSIMINKQEMVDEDIHFVYIYNDKRGVEVFRADIAQSNF